MLRLICFLIGEFLLFSAEQEADEAPVRSIIRTEAKITWKRAFRVWCALVLGLAAGFCLLLIMFVCLFFVIDLFAGWTMANREEFERAIGQRFGLTFGISLYVLTVFASVIVVRLILGRRLGDFRVVLVKADLPISKAQEQETKEPRKQISNDSASAMQ